MFVRNELRQLHEGSEQTGDTIDWNGDGSDEDAVHDLHQDERNNQYAKKKTAILPKQFFFIEHLFLRKRDHS